MSRATDPQRMNWLWRLVCEVADIGPAEVVEALHVTHVPVELARARGWMAGDHEDGFLPVSIAELERNLRALVLLREDNRVCRELAMVEHDQLALEAPMLDADLEPAGTTSGTSGMAEKGAGEVDESHRLGSGQ